MNVSRDRVRQPFSRGRHHVGIIVLHVHEGYTTIAMITYSINHTVQIDVPSGGSIFKKPGLPIYIWYDFLLEMFSMRCGCGCEFINTPNRGHTHDKHLLIVDTQLPGFPEGTQFIQNAYIMHIKHRPHSCLKRL